MLCCAALRCADADALFPGTGTRTRTEDWARSGFVLGWAGLDWTGLFFPGLRCLYLRRSNKSTRRRAGVSRRSSAVANWVCNTSPPSRLKRADEKSVRGWAAAAAVLDSSGSSPVRAASGAGAEQGCHSLKGRCCTSRPSVGVADVEERRLKEKE